MSQTNLNNKDSIVQATQPSQTLSDEDYARLSAEQAAEDQKKKETLEKLKKLEAEKKKLEQEQATKNSFISGLVLEGDIVDHVPASQRANYDLEVVNRVRSDISNDGIEAFYNWLLRSQSILGSKKSMLEVDLSYCTGVNKDSVVKQTAKDVDSGLGLFGGFAHMPLFFFGNAEDVYSGETMNTGFSVSSQKIDELLEDRLRNSLGKQSPLNGKVFDIRDLVTPNVLGSIKNAGIDKTHRVVETLLTMMYNAFRSKLYATWHPVNGHQFAPFQNAYIYVFDDLNNADRRIAIEKVHDSAESSWTYVTENSSFRDIWDEMFRAYSVTNSMSDQWTYSMAGMQMTSSMVSRLKFMLPSTQRLFYDTANVCLKIRPTPQGDQFDFSDRSITGIDINTFINYYDPSYYPVEGLTTRFIMDQMGQFDNGRFPYLNGGNPRYFHFDKTLLFETSEAKEWFDSHIKDYLRDHYAGSTTSVYDVVGLILDAKSITVVDDEENETTYTWTVIEPTRDEICEEVKSFMPKDYDLKTNIQDYYNALTLITMMNQYYAPDLNTKYKCVGFSKVDRPNSVITNDEIQIATSSVYSRLALSLGLVQYLNDEYVPYGNENILRNKIANYAHYLYGCSLHYVTKYFGSFPVMNEFGVDFTSTFIHPTLIARYKRDETIHYIPFVHSIYTYNGLPAIVDMSHILTGDGYETRSYNEDYSKDKYIFCEYIPEAMYWRYDYFGGQDENINKISINAGNNDEDIRFADVEAKFVNLSDDVGYIDYRLSPNGVFQHKRICTINISAWNNVFCLSMPKFFVNTQYVDGGRLEALHFTENDDKLTYYSPVDKVKRLIDRGDRTQSLKKALFN